MQNRFSKCDDILYFKTKINTYNMTYYGTNHNMFVNTSPCSVQGKNRLLKHPEVLDQSLIFFLSTIFLVMGQSSGAHGPLESTWGLSVVTMRFVSGSKGAWQCKLEMMINEKKHYLFWPYNSKLISVCVRYHSTNAEELHETSICHRKEILSLNGSHTLGFFQQTLHM